MSEKIQISKLTTMSGQQFYTKDTDRAKLLLLPGVKRIEDSWMTEEEYAQIPTSQEAVNFFNSSQGGTRASE